jgi:hypothetical protein
MGGWPRAQGDEAQPTHVAQDNHVLDVYLEGSRPVDLRLDGESLFPVWFKLEFKETGELSAKVKGVRLATRLGDTINIHQRQA